MLYLKPIENPLKSFKYWAAEHVHKRHTDKHVVVLSCGNAAIAYSKFFGDKCHVILTENNQDVITEIVSNGSNYYIYYGDRVLSTDDIKEMAVKYMGAPEDVIDVTPRPYGPGHTAYITFFADLFKNDSIKTIIVPVGSGELISALHEYHLSYRGRRVNIVAVKPCKRDSVAKAVAGYWNMDFIYKIIEEMDATMILLNEGSIKYYMNIHKEYDPAVVACQYVADAYRLELPAVFVTGIRRSE